MKSVKKEKRQKAPLALYESLQSAYRHFNLELFSDELPDVLFTVQRQHGSLGYFMPDQWAAPDGETCHEIAINPVHMGTSRLLEVLQTLVHEMVHCWQHVLRAPPKKGYHNKEWAHKMMDIGLQPSSTGKPGGDIIGYSMSDYVIEGGAFYKACLKLTKDRAFQLPWLCRLSVEPSEATTEKPIDITNSSLTIEDDSKESEQVNLVRGVNGTEAQFDSESILLTRYSDLLPPNTFFTPVKPRKSKAKYFCLGCQANVWGKPGLRLQCVDCSRLFESIE